MDNDPIDVSRTIDFSLRPSAGTPGVAWLEIHASHAVSLGEGAVDRLSNALSALESLVAKGELDALIVCTATAGEDLVGYDLEDLLFLGDDDLVEWSHRAQQTLRRLQELPIPTIAAIQGRWLGAGAELALACDYRVASTSPAVRIGLDQSTIGLLPAWGGTVHLPRLVGLRSALGLITTGVHIDAMEAKAIGLIDRVLDSAKFAVSVEKYARGRADLGQARSPGIVPWRKRLASLAMGGREILTRATGGGHAVVGSELLVGCARELILESAALPVERALAGESRCFAQLMRGEGARSRMRGLLALEIASAPSPTGGRDIRSAAVVGAGHTGSDFAHLLVSAGIPVRFKDMTPAAVRAGVARTFARIAWERTQGRISGAQATRRARRVDGVTGFGGFGTLDLLVSTGSDDDRSAVDLLAGLETHVRPDCVLAFHDWTVSPTDAQTALRNPERVVALLPSLPTDRFPLLEIVAGAQTSMEAIASARSVARRMGLTAVVSADGTPTAGVRLLGAFLAEASKLLDEGATVSQVDSAMVEFGFLTGPFHRADAIGAPRAKRLLDQLSLAVGSSVSPSALFARIADDAQTFYHYRRGSPAAPNRLLPEGLSPGGSAVTGMIQRRILLMLINEAAKILESATAGDPVQLELISTIGLGFPATHGGLLGWAGHCGIAELVSQLDREADRQGDRYRPAALLSQIAESHQDFFSHVDFGSGHHTSQALRLRHR